MAIKKLGKKRVVISFDKLSIELQEEIKAFYPLPVGYTEAMMRLDKPNGDFFYAVPYSTDEVEYLVKIKVKIDDAVQEEEDKSYYDEEIKASEEIADSSSESDDEDDM